MYRQQADVMLSAHFNQLIKPEVLQIPHLKCLNIHPSLLPKYKGVDPVFYALLHREERTGVTVHFQEEKLDAGRILQQDSVPIEDNDSLLSLNIKLFTQGAVAAVSQIKRLTVDSVGTAQGDQQRGYDSWPASDNVRVFQKARKLLCWRELLKGLYN